MTVVLEPRRHRSRESPEWVEEVDRVGRRGPGWLTEACGREHCLVSVPESVSAACEPLPADLAERFVGGPQHEVQMGCRCDCRLGDVGGQRRGCDQFVELVLVDELDLAGGGANQVEF